MDSYAIEWLRGLFHSFNFLHHDEILADRHVSGLSPVTKQSHAILTARSVQSIAAQPHTMVHVPNPSCIDGDELQVGTFGGPKKSERFSSWWSRYFVAIRMDAFIGDDSVSENHAVGMSRVQAIPVTSSMRL